MHAGRLSIRTHYCLIHFLFWFFYGDVTNYCSVYLTNCRFTGTLVGMVIAVGSILNVILQPWISAYVDRNPSLSLKKVILAMAAVLFGSTLLLYLSNGRMAWLCFALYTAAVLMIQLLQPYVNALGFNPPEGEKIDYGFARGIGSLGYVIMSYTIGSLITRFTPGIQPLSIAITTLLFIIVIMLYPDVKRNVTTGDGSAASSEAPTSSFLRTYRFFAVSLAGWMLILMGHTYLNSYLYQVICTKGGGATEMGIAMAIAAGVEIPIMLLFPLLLKKLPVGVYYRMAGVFFTLKILCTLLVPNVTLFYAVQLFQMLGWGVYSVSSVYFVNEVIPAKDRIKGQSYMAMSYTLGMIAGSLTGGVLIDSLGVAVMMIVGIVASAIGTVLVWRSERSAPRNAIE